MANSESKKLAIDVVARVQKLERDMAKASKVTSTNTRKMETAAKTMRTRMERDFRGLGSGALAGLAKSFAGPVAAALSLRAAVQGATGAMDEFDKIGKSAKSAGLDPEFFQELAFAADLGGVGFDKLSASLDTFNRNAGRAATGQGELVTNLRELNPELLANIQAARTQEERLRLVADAIRDEADASRQAALATAAFGRSGTKMVEVLKGGRDTLAETAAKARDLGIIIDRDLIARGEKLKDEFTIATRVLDVQFKQTMIELTPILIETAKLAGNVAKAINAITDAVRGLDDSKGAGRNGNQSLYEHLRATNPKGWNQLRSDVQGAFYDTARTDYYAGFTFGPDGNILVDRGGSSGGSGGGSTGTRNDAAKRAIDSAKALIDQLKFEQEQLGRTADAQELYNHLRSVGVSIDSEFGQQIAATLGPLQEQRKALEENAEAMAAIGDAAKTAMRTFIDDLIEGKSAADAFANALHGIGNRLIDAGLSAPVGSIFTIEWGEAA